MNEKSLANLKSRSKGDPAPPGAGRPKGSLNVKTRLAYWLKLKVPSKHPTNPQKDVKMSLLDVMIMAQVQKGMTGDTGAFSAIMDRFEGRPEQKVNNVFEGSTEITVRVGKPKDMDRTANSDNSDAIPKSPLEENPGYGTERTF